MKKVKGIFFSFFVALISYFLGKFIPIIGGPIFAILLGMTFSMLIKNKEAFKEGIRFTSKKILQYSIILLGFGLNLNAVLKTGKESIPIILSTIAIALFVAYIYFKFTSINENSATLIGVGSSICGGSAIAATAPVINASDEEIATSMSVIFFFNMLAALIFPSFGSILGFSNEAFAIFAGTAINDTSSVTAAASIWDDLYHLGSYTLDRAVTVKLTRTLAIIPITLILAILKAKNNNKVKLSNIFPYFIIFFMLASLFTTISSNLGFKPEIFKYIKFLAKFLIIMSMAAIGFNTNILKIIKTGFKPLILGFTCFISIVTVSIIMQKLLNLV